jgi:hypothetical protein
MSKLQASAQRSLWSSAFSEPKPSNKETTKRAILGHGLIGLRHAWSSCVETIRSPQGGWIYGFDRQCRDLWSLGRSCELSAAGLFHVQLTTSGAPPVRSRRGTVSGTLGVLRPVPDGIPHLDDAEDGNGREQEHYEERRSDEDVS